MGIVYDASVAAVRGLYDLRLHAPAVLDARTYFPESSAFRANWGGLRAEALHVTSALDTVPRFQDLMWEQTDIAAADQRDWRMLLLKAYGASFHANASLCPLLWSLIADSPLIVSASLSFLSPRKHIPRHRGPFRGILRFYMGLSVPTDDSGRPGTVLQINGVEYRLRDGEALLWDDTYPHEVWNHANAVRVALLLDVRRADLPPELNLLSRSIIAAVGCWIRARGLAGSDVPSKRRTADSGN